jgi:hypothetical protein
MKAQKKRGPGRPRESMLDKPLGRRVYQLQQQGLSYSQIGERLQISKQRAHQIYRRVVNERAEVC